MEHSLFTERRTQKTFSQTSWPKTSKRLAGGGGSRITDIMEDESQHIMFSVK